jgi:hypothetical protein
VDVDLHVVVTVLGDVVQEREDLDLLVHPDPLVRLRLRVPEPDHRRAEPADGLQAAPPQALVLCEALQSGHRLVALVEDEDECALVALGQQDGGASLTSVPARARPLRPGPARPPQHLGEEVEALGDADELVRLAAAAESASEQPLGQAVMASWRCRGTNRRRTTR